MMVQAASGFGFYLAPPSPNCNGNRVMKAVKMRFYFFQPLCKLCCMRCNTLSFLCLLVAKICSNRNVDVTERQSTEGPPGSFESFDGSMFVCNEKIMTDLPLRRAEFIIHGAQCTAHRNDVAAVYLASIAK